jgi:hypothetical protein
MIYQDNLVGRGLNLVVGALVFALLVGFGTYYLQDSLFIYKQFDAYTHWAVLLLALPILVGLLNRLLNISYPLLSTFVGALVTAGVLYPYYSNRFWAEAPSMIDMAVYVLIITGIGFIASQPIKTIFMMAFRLGRFSVPSFSKGNASNSAGGNGNKKTADSNVAKADMTKTQRMTASGHGSMMAMVELLIGVTSLGLSVFSIFFLGQG